MMNLFTFPFSRNLATFACEVDVGVTLTLTWSVNVTLSVTLNYDQPPVAGLLLHAWHAALLERTHIVQVSPIRR